jgi:hypothetical protein
MNPSLNDWQLEWQNTPVAQLRDAYVPDQFWVHFRMVVLENPFRLKLENLTHEWFLAHEHELTYRHEKTNHIMGNDSVILSSYSIQSGELALRGIGFQVEESTQTWLQGLVLKFSTRGKP